MRKYFLILSFIAPMLQAGPRQCQAYYNQMKANKNRNFKIKIYDKAPWFLEKDGLKFSENDKLMLETFSEICTIRFYLGTKNNRPTKTCVMKPGGRYCGLIEYGQ